MSHFFSSQNVMTQNQLVLSFYRFHSLLLVLSLLNSKMSQFFTCLIRSRFRIQRKKNVSEKQEVTRFQDD